MSEEEKKAIEYLENRLDILHNNTQWATEKSIKVVLNLIDKQQKEIEELQKDKKVLIKNYDKVLGTFISKDKIREIRDKAEVMDYYSLNDVIDDLSKLIGDYEEDD